ncbi:small membrane protein [Swine acute diarrhea syndrome related coronavirus]|uniref:Envelope small membrane protein n=15 Tax=Orthocoronavirinae TaxID=2501931 RepID=A8JNZ4_9ALPC|nr:small membrane protein [Rhinolophus bat coronavirus HKU2]ASK51719.1 small membrane protein [Porcine enteric alphacoronavirus GDS04]AVM41572.1 small membrane protein [Swine acute diarrhea syndrome coronavirus]AVM80477.1 small membrane protein [Swine acute diarrhea syndrome related coronavirus]QAS69030.1 envelope protein [Porcine enteric alphacoronavirus]UOK93813.1 envelope protein [Swine enteric alphacoronavirus]WCC62690.1 membrane protein [Bat Coronavirus RaGD16]WCC62710.1 membrane protei
MFLKIVEDDGLFINTVLWLLVLILVLLVAITVIKLIQLCFSCHRLMSNTIYIPVYNAYLVYKSYMEVEPCPIINV